MAMHGHGCHGSCRWNRHSFAKGTRKIGRPKDILGRSSRKPRKISSKVRNTPRKVRGTRSNGDMKPSKAGSIPSKVRRNPSKVSGTLIKIGTTPKNVGTKPSIRKTNKTTNNASWKNRFPDCIQRPQTALTSRKKCADGSIGMYGRPKGDSLHPYPYSRVLHPERSSEEVQASRIRHNSCHDPTPSNCSLCRNAKIETWLGDVIREVVPRRSHNQNNTRCAVKVYPSISGTSIQSGSRTNVETPGLTPSHSEVPSMYVRPKIDVNGLLRNAGGVLQASASQSHRQVPNWIGNPGNTLSRAPPAQSRKVYNCHPKQQTRLYPQSDHVTNAAAGCAFTGHPAAMDVPPTAASFIPNPNCTSRDKSSNTPRQSPEAHGWSSSASNHVRQNSATKT